jgi:hypothetical protein
LGHIQLALVKANDESKTHLELAEKEIRRCKNIIESLAKLGSTEKMSPQLTNLAQVAQDAINLVDHGLSQSHCKIYKDFRPCPLVNIDPAQVQQVLVALLNNAGQAMETTGNKNVTIRVLEVGGWAKIFVEDTGIGIRSEIKDKIFEPFFTTRSASKGMGLNLAVGQTVVKEFGGSIDFHGGKEGGTIFEIGFPIPQKRTMPEKALVNIFGGHSLEEGKPELVSVTEPPESQVVNEVPQVVPEQNSIPTYVLEEKVLNISEPEAPTQIFEMPNVTNDAIQSMNPGPMDMPPVPEEAIFLDRIRPNSIPIPSAGLPTSLPKRPKMDEQAPIEVPVTFIPAPQGMPQPFLRKVPDFKVTIRRPKLRG